MLSPAEKYNSLLYDELVLLKIILHKDGLKKGPSYLKLAYIYTNRKTFGLPLAAFWDSDLSFTKICLVACAQK